MIAAGVLDQQVTIQQPTTAASTQSGAGVVTFSTLATVPASVRALSGDERLAAGAIASAVSYEITARFRSDVTPAMRAVWTPYRGVAKTFEIHAVRPGGRMDGTMVLDCGVLE